MALYRPYIRKDVRAEVEARAPKNEQGQFLDANTGKPIEGTYDLGHKTGHEFRTEQAKAQQEGLTQAQFNDRMNNPDLYQIESPSSNRSHKFEDKSVSMDGQSTSLHRPYIRKDVRAEVEARAQKNEQGQFLDANTGKPIEGTYDLGHKAGNEYRTELKKAEAEGLTQAQFNDRMNNPDLYQIESPSSNRSHQFEASSGSGSAGKSCAEEAYGWQGVKKDEKGAVTDDSFPGHDQYQNGVISRGSDSTIYCTKWTNDQPGSGYFTDQATVDKCTKDGVLDSNALGQSLQTAPSNYGTGGGDYQQKPICTAYDINWDKLDELKTTNPELHGKLTNPDGLSPDNDGIKCAFGKAEANPQYGEGGGNQYYIDKDTFNQAKEAGVFQENPSKSFSEDKGNLTRQDIPNTEAYRDSMGAQKDAVAQNEAAKQEPTPAQLNSTQVTQDPSQPYIAQPDPAYNYGQSQSAGKPEDQTQNATPAPENSTNQSQAPPQQQSNQQTDNQQVNNQQTDNQQTNNQQTNNQQSNDQQTNNQQTDNQQSNDQKVDTTEDKGSKNASEGMGNTNANGSGGQENSSEGMGNSSAGNTQSGTKSQGSSEGMGGANANSGSGQGNSSEGMGNTNAGNTQSDPKSQNSSEGMGSTSAKGGNEKSSSSEGMGNTNANQQDAGQKSDAEKASKDNGPTQSNNSGQSM